MNGITIWDVRDLIANGGANITSKDGRTWVPARPLGWTDWLHRAKAAWMVWRCKADVVTWPEQ